jgi:hypothetical protein
MIYDFNIALICIAVLFAVALVFGKKEGFTIDPHNSSGMIPYIPQDVVCMILDGAKVDVDKYGTLVDKCQPAPEVKPDNSNICRI